MDIKEAVQARKTLENEIASFVSNKLNDFYRETHLTVERVDISMHVVRTAGNKDARSVVSGVRLDVRL